MRSRCELTAHISLKSARVRVILSGGIAIVNRHVDTMLRQVLKVAAIVHNTSKADSDLNIMLIEYKE